MESRAFHYGVLGLIGAAHLTLLLWTPAQGQAVKPPVLMPLTMVSVSMAAAPTPPQPKQATPKVKVTRPTVRKQATTAAPAPRLLASTAPTAQSVSQSVAPPAPANEQPATTAASSNQRQESAATSQEVAITPPTHIKGYLNNPKPEYPPLSLELAEEGTVYLRIAVNSKGKATAVSVAKSSGFPRLDNSARRTAAGWSFHPAMRGSEPVDYSYVTPIQFVLPHKTKA